MSVINNLKINIHRHSEGNVMTEESTAMYSNVMDPSVGVASLKDDNRAGQRGRSMVEMLGVLAIVGVLSVGGVYGYGVAMKKHKANELLHQASMLASTISAQIQSKGELPQSIEDFGDSKYGTFGTPTKVNDEQFKMEITGMDSAVCEQMEKMASGMVRQAKCNGTTLTLTYNNNLSSDKVAADYNGKKEECVASGRKYCLGSNSCVALDKECGCSGTNNGCQKCDTETGSFITDDEKEGENCTTANGEEGTCNAGVCEKTSTCPEGGEPSSIDSSICCGYNNYAWNDDVGNYADFNFEACGCPDDESGAEESKIAPGVCCWDGYILSKNDWDEYWGYNNMDMSLCGCPSHLQSPTVSGVCCGSAGDGGHSWDEKKQEYVLNIEACGCPPSSNEYDPIESTTVPGVCCLGSFAWNEDIWSYDLINAKACGCPTDRDGHTGTPSSTEPSVCCFGIYEWGYKPDDWEGYYSYNKINPDVCGCPTDEYGNTGTPSTTVSGVCCDEMNLAWDGGSYGELNLAACGCPYPGTESEKVAGVCCSQGFAWTSGIIYSSTNIEACGCPYDYQNERPGTPSSKDPSICCSGGMSWSAYHQMYYTDSSTLCD